MSNHVPIPSAQQSKELARLSSRIARIHNAVEDVLRKDFDRSLYKLTPQDDMRLLVIWKWSVKYRVTVRYILKAILPFWHRKLAKQSRSQHGLGVRVAGLTGKVSERILRNAVKEDYPENENVSEWKWRQRRRIIKQRLIDPAIEADLKPRSPFGHQPNLLDCRTVKEYVRKYSQRIRTLRHELDKACGDKNRRRRRYRNSPWF